LAGAPVAQVALEPGAGLVIGGGEFGLQGGDMGLDLGQALGGDEVRRGRDRALGQLRGLGVLGLFRDESPAHRAAKSRGSDGKVALLDGSIGELLGASASDPGLI